MDKMNRKRIIVIDDEASVLKDYLTILSPPDPNMADLEKQAAALECRLFGESAERAGPAREYYEVTTALQGEEGFEKVRDAREKGLPFALAFVDIRMPPGWDGLETAWRIRTLDPDIEIVIITAYSDRERSEIVEKVGTPEKLLYLKKPFDPDEIRQLALALTRKWELERKAEKHRKYLEKLLESVRRLKTLDITSVREVLVAILNEVIFFVSARKGFVATLDKNGTHLEITSEKMPISEADSLIRKMAGQLCKIEDICWLDEMMILPLKGGFGEHFVLVSDVQPPLDDEKFNLLRLLLETSSEVLTNVKRQEQYLKNERIAAIGQVAAGIIHEINNPLTAIIGAADMNGFEIDNLAHFVEEYEKGLQGIAPPEGFRKWLADLNSRFDPAKISKKLRSHYSMLRNGAERICSLMGSIRNFSKAGGHFDPKLADVSDALDDTLSLAYNSLKYGIIVHSEWESPLMAWCDLDGLRQVFLNLILNAVQAMKGKGELWITGKQQGEKILVSVKDSGPGIPAEVKDRIFDAFYTTKTDGTGLGLSIVRGIIQQHKGSVWVESEPGQGAMFHLEIPVKG